VSGIGGSTVLVTGASGFIGSHLTRRLVSDGARVLAMTSASANPDRLADVAADIELVRANVNDVDSLRAVVENGHPDLVVHLAAFTHVGRSFERVDENIQTNIQGTVNLLEVLAGDFTRFVYIGTGDIYGDAPVPFHEDGPVRPLSPYAVSKYAAERYCRMFHRAYDWPIVCLRPFNAYGPFQSGDRIIPELILAGLRGESLRMTEGHQTREFTYVEDEIDAFVRALVVPGIEGQVMNVGRGEEVSMRDIALTVLGLLDQPAEPQFGALPGRPNEVARMVGDSSRARELLGWEPMHSLSDGLEKTIAWYRERAG
jgi:nucleoside-diphosphate-sugar epimerase